MSSTDHPVPGPDEAGGESEPAAAPSRARVAAHGWWPWAAGLVLAAGQVVMLVAGTGGWRTAGTAGLVVVTLLGLGIAVFGGEE